MIAKLGNNKFGRLNLSRKYKYDDNQSDVLGWQWVSGLANNLT